MNFTENFENHYWNYWALFSTITAIANFVVFVGIALYIGGDALNGKIENGHYFLADHGKYTEVSSHIFTYSKIHAVSVLVTHSFIFLNAFLLFCEEKWKSKMKNT